MAADDFDRSEITALRALMMAMVERFAASKRSPHGELLILHSQARDALKAISVKDEDFDAEEVLDDIFMRVDHVLSQVNRPRGRSARKD